MSNNSLQKNILATLAYYDGMDYPMTAFEVWKYLTRVSGQKPDGEDRHGLAEVIAALEEDNLKRLVENYRGFYFLKGRQELVDQRLERNKLANEKLKKVTRIVRWLRYVPFVRMLAVTGSLAMKNTEPDSDLDLIVVLEHGHIFTGRFLVTALAQVLGVRRHGDRIANRICLNYFITTRSLEISLKDLFSASEYSFMLPIFGWHYFYEFQAANGWIQRYKPNFQREELPNLKWMPDTKFSLRTRRVGERLFNQTWLEKSLQRWQMEKIKNNPKTSQQGSLIVANEEMLIFLPKPQGPILYEQFQERISSLRSA